MKKAVWIAVLVFSLTLNLAVAATLGRNLWIQYRSSPAAATGTPALTPTDVEQIKRVCRKHNGAEMMEVRNKIIEKNFRLLELLAKDPVDSALVERAFNELVELKRNSEKQAISRITNVMTALPPEKRQAFVSFLKNRSCMMPAMGFGRGGAGRAGRPCPMPPDEPASSR